MRISAVPSPDISPSRRRRRVPRETVASWAAPDSGDSSAWTFTYVDVACMTVMLLLGDVLSRFPGVVAHLSGSHRDSRVRLFHEMCDHRDYSLRFRIHGQMAGVRNHRELAVRDASEGLDGVLEADEIVISERDENRRLD